MDSIQNFPYSSHFSRYRMSPWSRYLHDQLNSRFLKKIAKLTQVKAPEFYGNKDVLEVGPGLGRLYRAIRPYKPSYTACEPSRVFYEYCVRHFSNDVNFRIKNHTLENFSQSTKETFDLIFFVHVLEHAKNSYQALEWLGMLNTLLKNDGILIIKGPHFPSYRWRFFDIDWSHNFVTTRANVAEVCKEAGFEIIHSSLVSGIGGGSRILNVFIDFLRRCLPESLLNEFLFVLTKRDNAASDIITATARLDYLIVARSKRR